MDPITNADRFVALLRQKLAERASAQSARRRDRAPAPAAGQQGNEAVRAIAVSSARAGADDQKLRRILIEQLLADRFGAVLSNEPRFQQMVTQVTDMMAADPDLGAMIDEVMAAVRG